MVAATWQKSKGMCHSLATSSLASEAILQLIGSYHTGRTANWAAMYGYFMVGALGGIPGGRNAHMMVRTYPSSLFPMYCVFCVARYATGLRYYHITYLSFDFGCSAYKQEKLTLNSSPVRRSIHMAHVHCLYVHSILR